MKVAALLKGRLSIAVLGAEGVGPFNQSRIGSYLLEEGRLQPSR